MHENGKKFVQNLTAKFPATTHGYFRRCGSLIVSVLNSRASSLGLSPGWGHCVVFLGKTLYSQCLFPSRCINRYWQIYSCNPSRRWGGGGLEILLVTSCY